MVVLNYLEKYFISVNDEGVTYTMKGVLRAISTRKIFVLQLEKTLKKDVKYIQFILNIIPTIIRHLI